MLCKTEYIARSDRLLPWQATWLHQIWGKMLYLPKLYLLQMAPLDEQRVACGAKWFGTQFWCKTTCLTLLLGVDASFTVPALSVVGKVWTKCGRQLVGGYLRWRAGVLSRTSSHMSGNWSLPMFLLRNGSTIWHYVSLFAQPMVPSVVRIILVSITPFLRPDNGMLLVIIKTYLILQNVLFYITFEEFTYWYWLPKRMRNLCLHLQRIWEGKSCTFGNGKIQWIKWQTSGFTGVLP